MQALVSDGKVAEVTNPSEARAKGFINKRHLRVRQIFFKTVQREGNVWFVEGKVSFEFIFTATRSFRLNLDSETGEVISYEEKRLGSMRWQRGK
jgi:hypothetical protein